MLYFTLGSGSCEYIPLLAVKYHEETLHAIFANRW